MRKRRSLSCAVLEGSLSISRIVVLVCLFMDSSMAKNLSRHRSWIFFSKAVAMFMCMSMIRLRSVSSGSAAIADFNTCAFGEKSLDY